MISYFDTSAIVPLIISEPSTEVCNRLWNESARVVSARLLYPEARAALAKAERMERLSPTHLRAAIVELELIIPEVDYVKLTEALARRAGELAQAHQLRGYDAVHLVAALAVADPDLVLVTGDADLAAAANSIGIAVARTATN
jgi:uncharacterized protein